MIILKCVLHVQHAYFSSLGQSNSLLNCGVVTCYRLSSMLKLSIELLVSATIGQYIQNCCSRANWPVVYENDVVRTDLQCHHTGHNLINLISQHKFFLLAIFWATFETNQFANFLWKIEWFDSLGAPSLQRNTNHTKQKHVRVVFKWLSKVITRLRSLRLVIGLKTSCQYFNQWGKAKPIAPCTRDSSRALSKSQSIAKNSYLSIALFAPVVIGQIQSFQNHAKDERLRLASSIYVDTWLKKRSEQGITCTALNSKW